MPANLTWCKSNVSLPCLQLYAVKIINVTDLNKKERAAVAKEISILNEIQHPNIVKLVEVGPFHTRSYVHTEKLIGTFYMCVEGNTKK